MGGNDSLQQKADNAYINYQAALAEAQKLGADPTAANQTTAQKNALLAVTGWANTSQEANRAVQSTWSAPVITNQSTGSVVSSSSSSSTTTPSSPPPPPAPILPTFRPMTITNKNFKVAPSDIIQFDDSSVEIALIQDLLFEDIGATELANISRADLIDGVQTSYSPIKNLPTITREFNPNNIVATSYSTDYFARFGINILLRGLYVPYFNSNGDLVIEIEEVADDEEVQVEILQNGTIDMVDVL